MPTVIQTKKRFMEWLDGQVHKDQYIITTRDMVGSLTLAKKQNAKKVTFAFAADTFKRKDDVGHFAFGQTPLISLCVAYREDLSDESKNLIDESLIENPEKEWCNCINRTATKKKRKYICNGCNKEIKR